MSFKTIREVQNIVWPTVRDSLDRVRESREATKKDPNASTSAQTRARKPWNKVVSEETVWAIAKADLLATPKERAVIARAVEWYKTWEREGVTPDLDDLEEECALHDAVEELLEEKA